MTNLGHNFSYDGHSEDDVSIMATDIMGTEKVIGLVHQQSVIEW